MKLTKQEKNWILYDVGNSAFTMLVATILPIYFNSLAESAGLSSAEYLAFWGYAASACTLIVAVCGPILGTVTDYRGMKKPIFLGSVLLGAVGCVALGFVGHWLAFLVVFVVAKVAYSGSLIFYDAMLPDVTEEDRVDDVSSQGYAWGYIGSCIPFLLCLGVVLGQPFGLSQGTAMTIAFAITAVWWVVMTLPLLRVYRQKHFVSRQPGAVRQTFARLGQTLRELPRDKKVFWFLLAFFFYIDGVYTIIDMATAYGTALGLDTTGLLLALLVTQVVAFPSAILCGKLSRKYSVAKLISVCILAYLGIALFAMLMSTQLHFWILAVLVGLFQGGIQAMSRSYFTKIIPKEKSGEYFGLMDICGKGAAFLGTAVVSLVSQITGNASAGIGTLAILFVVGFFCFRKAVKEGSEPDESAGKGAMAMKRILLLCLLLLLLGACAFPQRVEQPPVPPVSEELLACGEEPAFVSETVSDVFQMTLVSQRTVYPQKDGASPLRIEVRLEYVGSGDAALLIHPGEPVFCQLSPAGGEPIISYDVELTEHEEIFTKGKEKRYEFSFPMEYELVGGFLPGEYEVCAILDCGMRVDGETLRLTHRLTLPIGIGE